MCVLCICVLCIMIVFDCFFFCFKQKTAYEVRISAWSSDVCSADLEYAMLELLPLRKGTTLTKEMFLNHLYGGMDEPELKIIDVFICKLRKKLALACGGENYIETVWGRGYVLRDPDEDVDAPSAQVDRKRVGEGKRVSVSVDL